MKTQEQEATEYLTSILSGICPNGVDIHCTPSDVGLAYTLIPKIAKDWGSLIGYKGKNIDAVRDIMKIWRAKHAPNLSISVWTPKPALIKEEVI